MSTKRLMTEYSSIQKELKTNSEYKDILELEPVDDLFSWKATIKGPQSSPFEQGQWSMEITIPSNYPLSPPKIKFLNKICHPNVNFKTGEICLDILQNEWTPAWTLLSTTMAIILLLQDPEPNSPLNVDASNLLKNGDLKGYNGLIRYYTHKYAIQ